MGITVYYVIRPNENFRDVIESNGLSVRLYEPEVWVSHEGGFSDLSISDHMIATKLIFLAQFWGMMTRAFSDAKYHEVASIIMGQPPFEVAIFDKWWDVERITIVTDFSKALNNMRVESLKNLARTEHNYVNGWLQEVIERKSSGKT